MIKQIKARIDSNKWLSRLFKLTFFVIFPFILPFKIIIDAIKVGAASSLKLKDMLESTRPINTRNLVASRQLALENLSDREVKIKLLNNYVLYLGLVMLIFSSFMQAISLPPLQIIYFFLVLSMGGALAMHHLHQIFTLKHKKYIYFLQFLELVRSNPVFLLCYFKVRKAS